MSVLALWKLLLSRWSGQQDVVVGTPIAGRTRGEIEGLIGFFVNTLVMRTDLAGEPSFAEIVKRVREASLDAYAHQDVPFEKLVDELAPERSLATTPLFQVLFVLQNTPSGETELPGALRVTALPMGMGAAKFDLNLNLGISQGRLAGGLSYSADLFDPTTVERLARQLEALAGAALAEPERPVAELSWLSLAERHQLAAEWNDSSRPPLAEPVFHRQMEAAARLAPDSIAVVAEESYLSYAALDRAAGRLAHELLRRGVTTETPVAVSLEPDESVVVALLGTLKAGGAYLPLDPEAPRKRLETVLAQSGARVLLTQSALAARLPQPAGGVIALDEEDFLAERSAEAEIDLPEIHPQSLAYVIFTSGSTGVPKGVGVEHRQISHYVRGVLERLPVGDALSFAALATFAADLGHTATFPALATGGTLHVLSRRRATDADAAAEYFDTRAVDVLKIVPSHLAALQAAAGPGRVLPRRALVMGGEAAEPAWLAGLKASAPGLAFLNHYGPTETTVGVLTQKLDAWMDGSQAAPLGRPLGNVRVFVVDRELRPQPLGVPGELLIAGDGGARGYLGQPGQTAERFVPDAFSNVPGARLYRTGDRARLPARGEVEFLGRIDSQVKVRGFRIELAEIASALSALPGVRQAVAVVRDDLPGGRGLVAYMVEDEAGVRGADLRDALRERLPDYMVPAFFIFLDALPLNPTGKVDRKALPAPIAEAEEAIPPSGPVAELLAGLYAELLGLDTVSAAGHFFTLGGHSLLATQLISRVREAFSVELPLRAVFESPAVADLAAAVEAEMRTGRGIVAPPLVPALPGEVLPLSFSQERLWFLDQLEPGSTTYNVPAAVRLRGPLDVAALAASFAALTRRHEVLRTRFPAVAGEPVPVVAPPSRFPLSVVDLTALSDDERPVLRLVEAEARRPFDLARGPVLRAAVLRAGADDHALAVTLHHIASDAWSRGILVRELGALYADLAQGREPELPPLPVQYADFAAWQRGWLTGEALEAEIAHWRSRLAGAPAVLELPTDRPRPALRSERGASLDLSFPEPLVASIHAFSRQHGATLFMTVLAAWNVLLSRWTGQQDLVIGTPIAGRTRVEVEGLIGFFINTLVLRTDLSGEPTFAEIVQRVREASLDAYAHQDVPFEKLVDELAPERSLATTPLFQAVFVLQNAPHERPALGELALEPLAAGTDTAKFDLTLALEETDGRLSGVLNYASDLFDPTTLMRLVGQLERLLDAAVAAPNAPAAEIPLASHAERQQALVEWNERPEPSASGLLLHQAALARAVELPERISLVGAGEHWSYAHLAGRSAFWAARLGALGLAPEARVGVMLDRRPELVAALLGTLQAGAVYVPLDPGYPAERLAFLVEDSQVAAVIVEDHHAEKLATDLALLSPSAEQIGEPSSSSDVSPEGLAYLIYTSGSTGRPKGVAIRHRSAVALLDWAGTAFSARELSGVLASTSINFDLSVFELFAPLAAGGSVLLARDALALPELAQRERVTLLNTVPSALAGLLEGELPASLATINLAGEALPAELVHRAYQRPGVQRVLNLYGPSEDTTYSTYTLVPRGERRVTVGRPLPGTSAFVVGRDGTRVLAGVPGELLLAGRGLARGYLGRPGLTAERFVPDAWSGEPGARAYRTGDRARLLASGEIEFLGRLDFQVKLRGFRIELGEVEAALLAQPGVRQAVAVLREDLPGGRGLVAYVVPEPLTLALSPQARRGNENASLPSPSPRGSGEGAGVRGADLRDALRRRLPEPMVPAFVVVLDALPLNPSGKVDRKRLPAPMFEPTGGAAPASPLEELVAGLYAAVLGHDQVGADGHFFELGGHSLLATQVVSRLREAAGIELPVRALFEAPTVAALAGRVEEALRSRTGEGTALHAVAPVPPLLPVPRDRSLPLSFAQQRLWFLDRLGPGGPLYTLPLAFGLAGSLDTAALAAALSEIVRRHEALRSVIEIEDGEPVQRVRPAARLPVAVVDLTALGDGARDSQLERLRNTEARRRFDLAAGPMVRATLVRLAGPGPEGEHAVLLTVHHVAADGWSLEVLRRELAALYGAFAEGRPSPLPPLAVQYADFAIWQREWLAGGELDRQLAYWRRRLAGVPVHELPTDRPRPPVQGFAGGVERWALGAATSAALAAFARREGATPFMVLVAAFEALLGRYSAQEGFALGTPIAGRTRRETEGLIGFFVNTLVLRADLAGDPTFRELLGRVREDALGAYSHQEAPFEKLVEELAPGRDLGRTPFFQVLVALQSRGRLEEAGGEGETSLARTGLALTGLPLSGPSAGPVEAKFDLGLAAVERGDGFHLAMDFRTDLFDRARVARQLRQLARVLEQWLAESDRPLSRLSWLSPAEEQQLRREWAPGQAPGEAVPLFHRQFEVWARRQPDSVAVVHGEARVSYGDLAARARALAASLRAAGVGVEGRVALLAEPSVHQVAGVLGAFAAQAALVPLDTALPPARLAQILADSAPRAVIADAASLGRLPVEALADSTAVLVLEDGAARPVAGRGLVPGLAPPSAGGEPGAAVAYVIYTSGSTGVPNGVEVPHEGLARRIADARTDFAAGPGGRVLRLASIGFDAAMLELGLALTAGGTLAIPTVEDAVPGPPLARFLAEREVTTVVITPSVLALLPAEAPLPALRVMSVGGESCPADLAARWSGRLRLLNCYGPTEATIYATREPAVEPRAAELGVAPSIGRPLPGVEARVVDRRLATVPLGVPGELLLAGAGIARGYLGRRALTAQRFVPDSGVAHGDRAYRTGDLVRLLADGRLDFLGRIDAQVKVRGMRIESGEVEAALLREAGVAEAAVVAAGLGEERRLVAYVVPADTALAAEAASGGAAARFVEGLRERLRERLPGYMVPSVLVLAATLPRTATGKLDRRALAAPVLSVGVAAGERVEPRNELESLVAGAWREVLARPELGVTDDFFALGGQSLLAVRLAGRLGQLLGRELPVSALFQAPTVEKLSWWLRGREGKAPEAEVSALVALREAGSRLPFFCVHPVGGSVFCYRELVQSLPDDRPFFAFQAPGLAGGEPRQRVEEMAADYVAQPAPGAGARAVPPGRLVLRRPGGARDGAPPARRRPGSEAPRPPRLDALRAGPSGRRAGSPVAPRPRPLRPHRPRGAVPPRGAAAGRARSPPLLAARGDAARRGAAERGGAGAGAAPGRGLPRQSPCRPRLPAGRLRRHGRPLRGRPEPRPPERRALDHGRRPRPGRPPRAGRPLLHAPRAQRRGAGGGAGREVRGERGVVRRAPRSSADRHRHPPRHAQHLEQVQVAHGLRAEGAAGGGVFAEVRDGVAMDAVPHREGAGIDRVRLGALAALAVGHGPVGEMVRHHHHSAQLVRAGQEMLHHRPHDVGVDLLDAGDLELAVALVGGLVRAVDVADHELVAARQELQHLVALAGVVCPRAAVADLVEVDAAGLGDTLEKVHGADDGGGAFDAGDLAEGRQREVPRGAPREEHVGLLAGQHAGDRREIGVEAPGEGAAGGTAAGDQVGEVELLALALVRLGAGEVLGIDAGAPHHQAVPEVGVVEQLEVGELGSGGAADPLEQQAGVLALDVARVVAREARALHADEVGAKRQVAGSEGDAVERQELAGGAAVRVPAVRLPAQHAEESDDAPLRQVGVERAHQARAPLARHEVEIGRAGLDQRRAAPGAVEVGRTVGHDQDPLLGVALRLHVAVVRWPWPCVT